MQIKNATQNAVKFLENRESQLSMPPRIHIWVDVCWNARYSAGITGWRFTAAICTGFWLNVVRQVLSIWMTVEVQNWVAKCCSRYEFWSGKICLFARIDPIEITYRRWIDQFSLFTDVLRGQDPANRGFIQLLMWFRNRVPEVLFTAFNCTQTYLPREFKKLLHLIPGRITYTVFEIQLNVLWKVKIFECCHAKRKFPARRITWSDWKAIC